MVKAKIDDGRIKPFNMVDRLQQKTKHADAQSWKSRKKNRKNVREKVSMMY